MESKKCLSILALVVALAVISCAQSHNITVGTKYFGDKLLLQEKIYRKSEFLRKIVIEKTFKVDGFISQIVAEDQKTNGNGAYASVIGGGPGQREVTMKFKSQRGHSIKFVVKIYGQEYFTQKK
ncbi:probable salivary secreted peptide [Belonocnema kinseyi]|uniref:probable salivary secreted peptide n=1 Tax=Belonocnema kinseyi TaxID=2817044 RepID=UPI00143DDC9B|nr:probable salivary secreted peptide [Belonocnema kinseyi]